MAEPKDQKSLVLNPNTIVADLQKMKGQIEAALPRHITPDRMARISMTALRMNPKLFRSTRESFFGAIITASQLGLEPGVNGQCYLIPYKNKQGLFTCTFIPGWRGYMDLLSRTGRAAAWTGAVYDGDDFDYEFGDKPFVKHKPGKWAGERAALEFTYSVGRQNGMEWPTIDVWDIDKVWAHRNKNNKVGDEHYSFVHPEMYARKIPLMQVLKYMPMSVEMNAAAALDVAGSEGKQRLTIDGAFSGSYEEDSKEATEIEFLMEKLNWDEEKRAKVRASYEGRSEELLAVLKKEAAPLEQPGGEKPAAVKKSRPPEPEPEPGPRVVEQQQDQPNGQGGFGFTGGF